MTGKPAARTYRMGRRAGPSRATDKREGTERRGKKRSAEEEAEFPQPILEKYERDPLYSSAWKDGINPARSRKVLALSLSAALNAEAKETKFGVFRM